MKSIVQKNSPLLNGHNTDMLKNTGVFLGKPLAKITSDLKRSGDACRDDHLACLDAIVLATLQTHRAHWTKCQSVNASLMLTGTCLPALLLLLPLTGTVLANA